jgi:phosphatidylinositol alpha-1,6-mannosyltransferase
VTTKRGAFPDTVQDGESAFVLDGPDPDELAERVLLLLGDPHLREKMGRAARARYEAHYTQDRADQRLADWLTRVAV